ncbi:MAG: hypothetical protein ACJ764_12515 [Solirubrobacteraceae bacterium]
MGGTQGAQRGLHGVIRRGARSTACAPPALVVEYHPPPGEEAAPAATAAALLRSAGYDLVERSPEAPGIGVIWARRAG